MKKLFLSFLVLSIQTVQAGNSTCKYEYSEMGREVFIEAVCSKVRSPEYEMGIFSEAYEITNSMFDKYCKDTPETLCHDDIQADAIKTLDAALEYIESKPELANIADFQSAYGNLKEYMKNNFGVPSLGILVLFPLPWDEFEPTLKITTPGQRDPISIENLKICNAKQEPWASMTCYGELDYFQKEIYRTLNIYGNLTHLSFAKICLENSGFEKCPYQPFK